MCLSYMCVYLVRWILRKPNVKGLEDDDNVSPLQEPVGLDFSSPWRQSYLKNRNAVKSNLHILHPTMQSLLRMGHESLSNLVLINCTSYQSVHVDYVHCCVCYLKFSFVGMLYQHMAGCC